MANNNVTDNIDAQDAAIQGSEALKPEQNTPEVGPFYKMDPKSRIPVSKYEGNLWDGRRKAGFKTLNPLMETWLEAEAYYSNSQMQHRRDTQGNKSGSRAMAKNRREAYSMTENIVYATINAVVPNIYAKNPTVEVTFYEEENNGMEDMLELLVNRLFSMKDAPGLSFKAKARKSIVRCEITNEAWIYLGWTFKDDSAEAALGEIQRISQALVDAKDQKEVTELEGQLMALEEACDLLDPAGPFCKSVRGDQVIVDDMSVEDDFSDANWMMMWIFFPTNYLNARYRQKNKDGSYVSAYQATHVVDASTEQGVDDVQREVDSFHILETNKDNPQSYNYKDQKTYDRAKRTKCWMCFDKVKRRIYLYADNDWTWPIWVIDDPYHLPRFYPLFRLQYHTDPKANRTKGEASNYLDQQDEINTIVDELNRSRTALRDNTLFDSTAVDQKTVEDILNNSNQKAKGIKVPDGKKLQDIIMPPPLPNLTAQFLWDKGPAKQAVTMISGIGEAERGEQYKTNTTNKAIDSYSSISGVRLDEKRDAIEDFFGDIAYSLLFMCMQFMDAETIGRIVGSKYQNLLGAWQQMDPKTIRSSLMCDVVGGSSQKPSSSAKKQEALQIGQMLGQFASVPAVVLVILKAFERSFDGFTVTAADWEMLMQSVIASTQQGNNAPGGGAQPGAGGQIDQLVQAAVAKGVPPAQAKQLIMAEMAKRNPQQASH